jgi:Cu/Ag efflux pump CusA
LKSNWEATPLEVTRNVEKTVEQLRPGLKGLELDTTIFRPATFIEMSLSNLRKALIWGCILVAMILVLFLFEWRTALISLTAISLSLMTEQEGQSFGREMILRGAEERLVPILMTACATALALLPSSLAGPGRVTRSSIPWQWSSWADFSRPQCSTCS